MLTACADCFSADCLCICYTKLSVSAWQSCHISAAYSHSETRTRSASRDLGLPALDTPFPLDLTLSHYYANGIIGLIKTEQPMSLKYSNSFLVAIHSFFRVELGTLYKMNHMVHLSKCKAVLYSLKCFDVHDVLVLILRFGTSFPTLPTVTLPVKMAAH